MIRIPRVEQLFGGQLDDAGAAAIRRMVDDRVPEFEVLDYKKELSSDKAELAKDVAAFANHQGGVLIFGVTDTGGVPGVAMPIKVDDALKRHVHSVVGQYVVPLPEFEVIAAVDDATTGDGFLLVVVAPSRRAPHAVVSPGEDRMRFPIRYGSQTRPMSESELADAYRSRFERVGTREARIDEITQLGVTRLDEGLWVTLTVVPEHPGQMHIDANTVSNLRGWQSGLERPSLWDGPIFERLDGRIAVHSVELLHERYGAEEEAVHRFLHLHDDGSGFGAAAFFMPDSVKVGGPFDPTNGEGLPLSEIGMTAYLIEELHLLAQHAVDNTGTWGTAVAHATVTRLGSDSVRPLVLCRLDAIQEYSPVQPVRIVRDTPTARRAIDLTDITGSARGLLAAAYLILAELQQTFGVAETPYISADGSLRINQIPGRLRQEADRWARHVDAPSA